MTENQRMARQGAWIVAFVSLGTVFTSIVALIAAHRNQIGYLIFDLFWVAVNLISLARVIPCWLDYRRRARQDEGKEDC